MREQLVTHAMPQKNWPMHVISDDRLAQFWSMSAEMKTAIEMPAASLTH